MIELDHVVKRYGDAVAVNDVSLRVAEGELLVLLGGSGCGKTTTLKMVNRLVTPSSGRVLVGGEDVTTLAPHELRRRIGYAFQKVGLFPHMSVAENVGIVPRLLGWDAGRIQRRVDELLVLVDLDPRSVRERRPRELSGGQEQRVGVARALAAEPRVMLLDEPFGALDPVTRERLQESFQKIKKALGLTAIFVTHDVIEAFALADRIGVMNAGRLVQIGTARELLQAPADDYVAELTATPRRHARVLAAVDAGVP